MGCSLPPQYEYTWTWFCLESARSGKSQGLLENSGGTQERGEGECSALGLGSAGNEELGEAFVGNTIGKGPLSAWDVVGARGAPTSH